MTQVWLFLTLNTAQFESSGTFYYRQASYVYTCGNWNIASYHTSSGLINLIYKLIIIANPNIVV